MQLSKEIGITQKSAWFLEMRIRAACGNQTTELLSGVVEMDETYLGGKEKNKHKDKKLNQGRGTVGKTVVFGVRERYGRMVGKVVKSTDAPTLQGAVRETVAPGSVVFTDEHASYKGLNGEYVHKTVNHSAGKYVDGYVHVNSTESTWAVLKRGRYGIFHFWGYRLSATFDIIRV